MASGRGRGASDLLAGPGYEGLGLGQNQAGGSQDEKGSRNHGDGLCRWQRRKTRLWPVCGVFVWSVVRSCVLIFILAEVVGRGGMGRLGFCFTASLDATIARSRSG